MTAYSDVSSCWALLGSVGHTEPWRISCGSTLHQIKWGYQAWDSSGASWGQFHEEGTPRARACHAHLRLYLFLSLKICCF